LTVTVPTERVRVGEGMEQRFRKEGATEFKRGEMGRESRRIFTEWYLERAGASKAAEVSEEGGVQGDGGHGLDSSGRGHHAGVLYYKGGAIRPVG